MFILLDHMRPMKEVLTRNTMVVSGAIPKGKAISDYPRKAIKRICQTINNLPRKILDYQQPVVAFEQEIAKLA